MQVPELQLALLPSASSPEYQRYKPPLLYMGARDEGAHPGNASTRRGKLRHCIDVGANGGDLQ